MVAPRTGSRCRAAEELLIKSNTVTEHLHAGPAEVGVTGRLIRITAALAVVAAVTRSYGYSVCSTAEVLVQAAQLAGPSAPTMAMASPARASSSRSVPPST
jgi:hypothetical protein